MGRRPLLPLVTVFALTGVLVPVAGSGIADASTTRYVAPGGSGTNRATCEGGTAERPWGSIEEGMRCLRPGDTLIVRGGSYTERVLPVIRQGRPDAPIIVRAADGEWPVVRGLVRLDRPDHWSVRGLNVQGQPNNDFPVKLRGGVGWSWEDAEIWGGHSYGNIIIEVGSDQRGPRDWRLAGNCIHTAPTRSATGREGTDHNVYVDVGRTAAGGVIERNLVFGAPNGANIKLGPGGADPNRHTHDVTLRFNTFWGGVHGVLANAGTSALKLHRNIVGGTIGIPGQSHWWPNVRGFALTGSGNVASHNLGHGTSRFIYNDAASTRGWVDGGGNRHPMNPAMNGTSNCRQFRPQELRARTFGHMAPEAQQRRVDLACDHSTRTRFSDVPSSHAHARTIRCVDAWSITSGYPDGTYRPAGTVNRAQMATFVTNLILRSGGELPDAPARPRFRDIPSSSPHRVNAERLAAAGIVSGTTTSTYEPDLPVNRAQMATFLAAAYEHVTGSALPRGQDFFPDDDGTFHEPNINRIAGAGFTGGLPNGSYGGRQPVSRAAMASFLIRVVDTLIEDGVTDPL